mgnify:FL=1
MRGERIFMNIAVIIVGIILSCLTFALAITVIIAKQKKKSAYLQKKKSAYLQYKRKVTSEPIIQFSTKELLHKNSDQPLLYPEETYMLVLETNEIDELQKEKYITLKQGDNIFGRDKQEADFVIKDQYVSKKHFIIKVFGTQLILIDCESMNGTYLNHKRVDVFPESIKKDDEIQVSHTRFIVRV